MQRCNNQVLQLEFASFHLVQMPRLQFNKLKDTEIISLADWNQKNSTHTQYTAIHEGQKMIIIV